mgnify:FL=1
MFIDENVVLCNILIINAVDRVVFSIRQNPIQYTTEWHSLYD